MRRAILLLTAVMMAASAFAGLGPAIQLKPQSYSVRVENDDSSAIVPIAPAPRVGVRAQLGIAVGADIF